MPRRRTTKAGIAKRLNPEVSGEEGKNLDKECRRIKVETLIKDFKTEITSRTAELEQIVNDISKRVDLTCTLQMLKIAPMKNMLLTDFLKQGGRYEDTVETDPVSEKIRRICSSVAKKEERKKEAAAKNGDAGTLDKIDEEAPSSTSEGKPRKRKGKEKAARAPVAPPPALSTNQRTIGVAMATGSKVVDLVTPSHAAQFSGWSATPLITPKFDPRLIQTPGVAFRVAKPDEVLVSLDGSPIMNAQRANAAPRSMVVPAKNQKSIFIPLNVEDSSQINIDVMDEDTILSAYEVFAKFREQLNIAKGK